MAVCNYERELINGVYNINNPERKDAEGNQLYLYQEVEIGLNKDCDINALEIEVTITFTEDLTQEEKATLDIIVNNHKNNS